MHNHPEIDSIAIVIVSYNPTSNIVDLISVFDNQIPIFVIDNHSTANDSKKILNELQQKPNVELIINNSNLGIAKALNQGVVSSIQKNKKWTLLFDQDSLPNQSILESIQNCYQDVEHRDKIALIGVNYDTNASRYVKQQVELNKKFIEIDTIITSGSILNNNIYTKIGPFIDDFFIDCVDLEYGLRIIDKGYKTYFCTKVGFKHKIGELKTVSLFGLKINSTNHNVLRRYYMARNNVIISKRYFYKYPKWVIKKNIFYLISFLQIILVDDNKIDKIKSSLKGILNGIKN